MATPKKTASRAPAAGAGSASAGKKTKKTAAAKAKPAPRARAKAGAAGPFLTEDREAAFRHFAAKVASVPEDALEHWHYDAEILCTNAARCAKALAPHLTEYAAKLPHVDMNEIREMPALALALAFAARRVVPTATEAQIQKVQQRQRPRRRLALMQLEILRDLELLEDPKKVDAILAGRGAIDQANDGVNAVAVFNENAAAIEGKHPFSAEWLQKLRDDSNWLLQQLKRKGAKSDKPSDQKEEKRDPDALVRDRLFTELLRRHGQAKKVAVEVWGWKRVDEFFPSLFEREAAKASAAPGAGAQPPAKGEGAEKGAKDGGEKKGTPEPAAPPAE